MLRAAVVLAVVKLADAHGSMSQPRSRQQHGLNIDGSNCAPPQRFAPALRSVGEPRIDRAAHRCCSRMLLTRGPCPGDPSKFGNSAACTAACMGEACEWFNDGCVIGCDACSNSGEYYCNEPMPNGEKSSCYPPASQNGCTVDGKLSDEPPMPAESLPHEFRTWDMNGHSPSWGVTGKSMTANHPWRAPGHSPISNPCGIASGTVPGLPGGGDAHGKPPAVPTGYKRAMNGTDLPELEGGPTSWSESSNAADALCHVNIF